MKGSSYQDHDYAFGQTILTLRARFGLTQAGLAKVLNVSRRALGNWEAGSSYPKPEHLKQLLALAVEHKVFPKESQEEELRALWKAAHQKVLLDEAWLAGLIGRSRPAWLWATRPAELPAAQCCSPGLHLRGGLVVYDVEYIS